MKSTPGSVALLAIFEKRITSNFQKILTSIPTSKIMLQRSHSELKMSKSIKSNYLQMEQCDFSCIFQKHTSSTVGLKAVIKAQVSIYYSMVSPKKMAISSKKWVETGGIGIPSVRKGMFSFFCLEFFLDLSNGHF